MPRSSRERMTRLFRYFFGGLLAVYGLFAFLQPEKYSIGLFPINYVPLVGLIICLIGLVIIFYKNED